MNDEQNNPLLCQGRTKLQDGEQLVRGQAICHNLVVEQEQQEEEEGSLTTPETTTTTTTTTTTIWAFGLDWFGHPIFYTQQLTPQENDSDPPSMTVLWQETSVSGDYLQLEGTTGQLLLMVDHDDDKEDENADTTTTTTTTTNADEPPPPAQQSQPVWGIGGCGQLEGTDLALYQLTIAEDEVNLGIIGSSQGALWSLRVQEQPPGQVIRRDECPVDDHSLAQKHLDNDGLQDGGMVGLVLGAAVLGILLGMWVRQKYPSSCGWWCCSPRFSPTDDDDNKDGEKDPQRDRTNSSSTNMDSPNRQPLEVPEVTL